MIVVRFLQFLAALFVVRLVLRAVAAMVRARGASQHAPPVAGAGATKLVHDRICNVHLPRDRALPAKVDGQVEYFCSEKCRDEALRGVRRAS